MIGTSTFELIEIRCAIFSLRYVAPLAQLFCISNVAIYGFKAALSPVPLAIGSIAIAETLFYSLLYLPYRAYLQRDAVHPPALSKPERKELFKRCNANIPDGEAYLNKWFLGAPAEQIKRENVKEFFLWAFFNRGGPAGDDDEELEEYLALTEEILGRKIEPGRGDAKCLRLTLDKVDMLHRPLLWYLVRLHSHTERTTLTLILLRLLVVLIFSPICTLSTTAFDFTALPYQDFSPSFRFGRRLSLLLTGPQSRTRPTGTARTRQRQNFPFFSSMGLGLAC